MEKSVWRIEYEHEVEFLRSCGRGRELESGVLRLLVGYLEKLERTVGKQEVLEQMAEQIVRRNASPTVVLEEIEFLLSEDANEVSESIVTRESLSDDHTTLNDLSQHFEERKRDGCVSIDDVRLILSQSTVWVVGDTHGDAFTTQRIIEQLRDQVESGSFCVFLGDYVNNGLRSLENLVQILRFRSQYPRHVVLLGGNHEVPETYATATREFFQIHWDNAVSRPFLDKQPPAHYGHLRLEMISNYGVEDGERLYHQFGEWGRRLPYVAFVSGQDVSGWTMLSHSVGLAEAFQDSGLTIFDIVGAKEAGRRLIDTHGFEAWKRLKMVGPETQHLAMVNSRYLSDAAMSSFRRLGVVQACVGHMHYRSGLRKRFGGIQVDTLCSSIKTSADAGHYMFQELVLERVEPGGAGYAESLPLEEAVPCVGEITKGEIVLHFLPE